MRVEQLINTNGNPNANQFIIYDGDKTIFQSYNSIVCEIKRVEGSKVVKFGSDWDYSRTTMKHLNTFLSDNGFAHLTGANTIRKAIKKGESERGYKVIYDPEMC